MKKQPHDLTHDFPIIPISIPGINNSVEFCFRNFLQNDLKPGTKLDWVKELSLQIM